MLKYWKGGITMKIATVGTSDITKKMLSAIRSRTDIALAAVYSRSGQKAEAFAREQGAGLWFTDLAAMAASDAFDAVYIASPNALHEAQARLFLEHGKHVLCEKPMTVTREAEEALYALAEEKGLVYMEAIMSIHTPAFGILQRAIGGIGTVRSVSLQYCQLSSRYPALLRGEVPNIFDPALKAGCLMDIGVYPIYLAAALFGRPKRILSAAEFLSTGADAAGAAILQYDGLTVDLHYSKVAQSFAPSEILGDHGTITIDAVSLLTGIRLRQDGGVRELVPGDLSRDDVMGAEASFFAKTVKEGYSPAYRFAKETSLLVREITDEIRRQNGFPF